MSVWIKHLNDILNHGKKSIDNKEIRDKYYTVHQVLETVQ